LYGKSGLFSYIINASISALKAIQNAYPFSGDLPFKSTIKPVFAIFLIDSKGISKFLTR